MKGEPLPRYCLLGAMQGRRERCRSGRLLLGLRIVPVRCGDRPLKSFLVVRVHVVSSEMIFSYKDVAPEPAFPEKDDI